MGRRLLKVPQADKGDRGNDVGKRRLGNADRLFQIVQWLSSADVGVAGEGSE